jgi:site-specific DNA-methyltransferase (adenine-specific)
MSGRIICGDARTAIPDVPVHLMVCSPPYNVGMAYDEHEDLMDPREWRKLLWDVFRESWDRLVDGGRMAVNIQHTYGRAPAQPLGHEVERQLLELPRALYRGAIIWDKGAVNTTGWGSWRLPRNPVLRGCYEMIYVVSKGSYAHEHWSGDGDAVSDITAEEFRLATADVWRLNTKDRTIRTGRKGQEFFHPAPFDHTLAQRLIQLYSWPGDTVLDPFFGSGTTGMAAEELGRDWIGVDISEEYCRGAARRIAPFEGMEVQVEFL